MEAYKVSLNLRLADIVLLFSEYELELIRGETVHLNRRPIVPYIFEQLSEEEKNVIKVTCPRVVEFLIKL